MTRQSAITSAPLCAQSRRWADLLRVCSAAIAGIMESTERVHLLQRERKAARDRDRVQHILERKSGVS